MAEIVALVGIVSSFIQVADSFTRTTSQLKEFIRVIRHAPQEVEFMRQEASTFSTSLVWFQQQLRPWYEGLKDLSEKRIRKEHVKGLLWQCETVDKGFRKLLDKYFADKTQQSRIQEWLDRIRWYFRQPEVAGLRVSLCCVMRSVNMFITLAMFDTLMARIRELEAAAKGVPGELREQMIALQKELKRQKKEAKEARRRLEENPERIAAVEDSLRIDVRLIIDEGRAQEKCVATTLRHERQRNRSTPHYAFTRRRSSSQNGSQIEANRINLPVSPPPTDSSQSTRIEEVRIQKEPGNQPPATSRPNKKPGPLTQVWSRYSPMPSTSSESIIEIASDLSSTSNVPLTSESQERNSRVIGSRIIDDGNQVRETSGEWPSEVFEPIVPVPDNGSNSSQHQDPAAISPQSPVPTQPSAEDQVTDLTSKERGKRTQEAGRVRQLPRVQASVKVSSSEHSPRRPTLRRRPHKVNRSVSVSSPAQSKRTSPFVPMPPFDDEDRAKFEGRRSS